MFNKLGGARMPIGDYLERFGCPSVENTFGDRVFAGMAKMHMMDDSKHGGGWYPIQDYARFTAPEPFSKNNAQLPALRDAPAPTSSGGALQPATSGAAARRRGRRARRRRRSPPLLVVPHRPPLPPIMAAARRRLSAPVY